ncbi:MAG: lysoplasmalogenase [Spirochaetales bacterium]
MPTPRIFDWAFAATALLGLALIPVSGGPWIAAVKALPALVLAASWFVLHQPGWKLMGPALVFAAGGDFLLSLSGLFVPGMGSFAVMQLLYLVRFWGVGLARPKPRRGLVTYPVVFAVITAAVMAVFLPHMGDLAIPMALYGVLLATMTVGGSFASRDWQLRVGVLLFFVSDGLILAFRVWKDPTDLHTWAIMITYYVGQVLITRGARKL